MLVHDGPAIGGPAQAEGDAEPDIRARFDTFAFEVLDWSPQEIRRQVELRSSLYESLVRRGNISLD